MAAPVLSIVIPAHDEEAIIGATLRGMLAGAERGEFDVIVAANGCSDRTADIARGVSPDIRVIEVAEPSKTAALNAGDDAAAVTPRAYIDADVRVDAATLRALANTLNRTAAPRIGSARLELDTRGCTWPARQYFRIWLLNDYNRIGRIGSGVYAVNAAGRARWARFPEVIADDRFVQQRFALHERVVLDDGAFSVPAPQSLRAQVRRSVRVHAGNAELREHGMAGDEVGGQVGALVRRVLRRPTLWPAFAVYCAAYLVVKLEVARHRRTGTAVGWRRDETSRAVA